MTYLLGPAHFACTHDGVSIDRPESAPDDDPPMMGLPCDTSDDCESDEVCAPVAGCQKAWGWAYGITFSEFFVPLTRPDGTPWDRDGSPPDPDCWARPARDPGFHILGSANWRRAETTTQEVEGYRFVWKEEPWMFSTVDKGRGLKVSCVDHDTVQEEDSGPYIILDDYCWGNAACDVPVEVLHGGETVVEQNGAVLKMHFIPAPSRP